jgi:hypothetical protein
MMTGVVNPIGTRELTALADDEFHDGFDDCDPIAGKLQTIVRMTACLLRKLGRGSSPEKQS